MKVDDQQLLAMVLSGQTQTEIAKALNMTKGQVSRRVNSDNFQGLLSEYRKKVLDGVLTSLIANSQKAVNKICSLLDSENEYLAFQSAVKVLSMAQDYGIQKDLLIDIQMMKQQLQSQESYNIV